MRSDALAPLVSVLMPAHAHAHFICRAVESLRAQTLTHWELIVVDDGSPDDTRGALGPYLGDPRIRYERLSRNVGLGAALNCAMDLAHGQLIAYLPSDDVLYAAHLRSLQACLLRRAPSLQPLGERDHRWLSAAARADDAPAHHATLGGAR
jgi:glycosyltransferase involved in cell wall biosynthesis